MLVDLQGPKLRVGEFAGGGADLKKGARFTLDSDKTPGDENRVRLPHPEILRALEPGHAVLIDDGKVRLHIIEAHKNRAVAEVDVPGRISNRKGVSLPDTIIPVSAMTEKDRSDLEAALDVGVDWIAVSFVQRPEDIAEVRKIARGRAGVLAKIEKPQAIARLDEIIEISDALMVARGDLGVEMPVEKVPGLQKRITRMARRSGKPVVVATQMLESMITSPVPTRAEVSDVATAVYRRRRRDHAVGGKRVGTIPARSRRHDGSHRGGDGDRRQLSRDHRCPAHRTGINRRGRDRGGRARMWPKRWISRPSARGRRRARRRCASRANARARPCWPSRPTATRRAGSPSCGACSRW